MNDKISIILPIFNVGPHLKGGIDSLINQTIGNENLEIIMVNDCSTDGSDKIIDEYAEKYDCCVAIHHETNSGGAHTPRNTGIEAATGDYIMFLDADDYLLPDCLEIAVREIGDNDILQFGMQRVTKDGQQKQKLIPYTFYRLTSACARLYNRQWLEQHPVQFEENVYYEDVYFSVRLWLLHPHYKIIHYLGYCYTVNPDSTTSEIHYQDKKALCDHLRRQLHSARTFADKAIVAYTLLRVKLHFIKEQRKLQNT